MGSLVSRIAVERLKIPCYQAFGCFEINLDTITTQTLVRRHANLAPNSAWIVVAEVWPLSARPYGIALGASSNWMNNFIVGQVTPDMITHMRYGTFILFGMLITIGAAFVWFYGKIASDSRLSGGI